MKNLDEEEKLLRQKIEESAFEYDEQYWKQAQQMLEPKRRRRFAFWWFGGALLLLISAGGIYFMTNQENKNENVVTINNATQQKDKSPAVNEIEKTGDELNDKVNDVPSSVNSISENHSSPVSSDNVVVKPESLLNQQATNRVLRTDKKEFPIEEAPVIQKESVDKNIVTAIQEKNKLFEERIVENHAIDIAPEKPIEVVTENFLSNDIVQQLDTTATVTAQPETEQEKSLTPNPLPNVILPDQIISISGGVNFNKGINATGARDFSLGVVPFIGAEYSRAIDKQSRKMLGLGLQLCILNKLNSKTEIHHSDYFSFGYGAPNSDSDLPPQPVSDTVFTLNQKALYTLQLPVLFTYAVTENHRIRAGVGVSYMLDGYGDVLNFDGTRSKSFGYSHGFNPVNVFVQVGYIYRIGNKWSVGFSIQQGLTDITDDSFFQSNNKDLNTDLLLGVRREFTIKSKKIMYDIN